VSLVEAGAAGAAFSNTAHLYVQEPQLLQRGGAMFHVVKNVLCHSRSFKVVEITATRATILRGGVTRL